MLSGILDWIGSWSARARLRRTEARVAEAWLDFGERFIDTDLLRFGLSSDTSVADFNPNASLASMRKVSRRLVRTNAHARNLMTQLVNFSVGPGFAVKFRDPALAERWKSDSRTIRWHRRAQEIVRRVIRDGEAFVRRFGPQLRFVEPEDVRSPDGQRNGWTIVRDGVETRADDAETVLAYWIAVGDGQPERVDAREVWHFRDPISDLAEPRGRPMLYDAARDIENYAVFLTYRQRLNIARAALAVVRKHAGKTPAQVRAFADKIKSGTLTRGDQRSMRWQFQLPGVGVDITDDVDLEFPSHNLGASEAAADGRAMRLLIACWFGLPEYLVTCDAENANFSSTLVAENPGIKALASFQRFIANQFVEFFSWYYGDPAIEVDFSFPTMVLRKPREEQQANEILFTNGIMSRRTWQERAGIDPDVEQQRLAQDGALEP